jgi:hypothetical protein
MAEIKVKRTPAESADRAARRTPAEVVAPGEYRQPRLGVLWAALVYVVCTLALMYPAVGGQLLVSERSDQFGGVAYREFAASVLRETGSFPHWNPYILGGLPMAAGHGDIYYPMFLFRAILPVDDALNLSFGLHLVLAGLFAYCFLRSWSFQFFPSLIGGLAYMLSGQIASLVSPGHDGKLYVSALAPLMLWMITLGVRDGRLWSWGVIALTTGLCILSPHYQMTYYLGVLAGGFTLWLAFRRGDDRLERGVALKRIGLAAAAALVGVGIASIQFLPFFEYIPFSPREGGRGYEYATSFSMPPEELLNAYLPEFSGILDAYWGRNPLKFHSEYLGAAVLTLAGAAFGWPRRRGLVIFWVAATLLALLVAFGGHTPFYRLWYLLPMMNVVRAPSMIYFIVSLAVAAFAAVGVERFLAGEIRTRYLSGWAIASIIVALLASVGLFVAIGESVAPEGKFELVRANATTLTLGGWRSAFFVLAVVGVLWLVARGKLRPTLAGGLLAGIVALDLWSVDRLYFNFSPQASTLYASDPAIDYLKRLEQPARVLSFDLPRRQLPDAYLGGEALMMHRVRTTTGHQGNELQTWVTLAGAKSPALDPRRLLDPQFLRLSNTRFWYTNGEWPETLEELPGVRLVRRVGPVQNSFGNTVYLYEIQLEGADQPAAWVAPVIVKAPPEPTLATVLDPRFDPRQAAIFDSASSVAGQQINTLPTPSTIGARLSRQGPERITIELDAPSPPGSALVVSENWYPAWRATVDGREVPVARADFTFIGVPLPAGARRVELTFEQASYRLGKTLTLIALALSAAMLVGGVVVERRARG